MDSLSAKPKRPTCARCLRASSACICDCAETVEHLCEVLILQHPDEARHIKSSGRLLHLCLPHSQIEIGLAFEPSHLNAILQLDGKQNVLLYPETESPQTERNSPSIWQEFPVTQLRLIILDASWRQSRVMLKANPQLQSLPRMGLRETPNSRYVIRRAHKADQLSSLEACAYALQILEPENDHCLKLLDAFDRFNHMQLAAGVHRLKRSAT